MTDTEDQAQIDALMARFYGAFDNRQGRVPQADDMCSLFTDSAVITQHRDDGRCEFHTPDDFVHPRIALLTEGSLTDFHEWEETSDTRIIGRVASRSSHYAKQGLLKGACCAGQGSKLFQLVKLEDGWCIVAMSWISDVSSTAATPP